MTKIYIRNKPLFLVDKIDSDIEQYLHQPDTIFIDELNAASVKTMIHQVEQTQFYRGVFLHQNETAVLNAFKTQLNVIAAAGGMVYTEENEVLLIQRLGHWDLPKGKLDEGESLEECALREIGEETGAKGLTIQQPLMTTYHTYHQHGKNNLKESHWFLVKSNQKTTLTPQTEEDITQTVWVPLADIQPYVDGAYPSVADVLKKGMDFLQSKSK